MNPTEACPLIDSFEMAGAFALTEADHGSDVARGLETSGAARSSAEA
jgi:alkylation response protein AidB-like acyl-CoA dehydrogenase